MQFCCTNARTHFRTLFGMYCIWNCLCMNYWEGKRLIEIDVVLN